MRLASFAAQTTVAILATLFIAPNSHADDTVRFPGTYSKGHNITEPRPASSRYFQTTEGGVVVIGNKAGFYLYVKMREQPQMPLYVRIEYENPEGGSPASNDMDIAPGHEAFGFSSPDFVKGLKIYSEYKIVVKAFISREAHEPIDVLCQTVRSYVDSRQEELKVFRRLKRQ
jgi:hypothetical protein